jgi:hypothetical protein
MSGLDAIIAIRGEFSEARIANIRSAGPRRSKKACGIMIS